MLQQSPAAAPTLSTAVTIRGISPIHTATIDGNLRQVELLLMQNPALLEQPDIIKSTPLHVACVYGHIPIIRHLIECGARLEARDNYGSTPLIVATDVGVVELLVSFGANIDAMNINNISARQTSMANPYIHLAIKNGTAALEKRRRVVRHLLTSHEHVVLPGPQPPLHHASKFAAPDTHSPMMGALSSPRLTPSLSPLAGPLSMPSLSLSQQRHHHQQQQQRPPQRPVQLPPPATATAAAASSSSSSSSSALHQQQQQAAPTRYGAPLPSGGRSRFPANVAQLILEYMLPESRTPTPQSPSVHLSSYSSGL